MLVHPNRAFPGALFLRGSAISELWPWLLGSVVYAEAVRLAVTLGGLEMIDLTVTPFSLVGLALSIFLGFRNNACYDRWWEARRLWGQLVNTSRSFARDVRVLVSAEPQVHRELVLRAAAFPHALRLHLREQARWHELEGLLPADELIELPTTRNPPQAVLDRAAQQLGALHRNGAVHPLHLPTLLAHLTTLTDVQGACERIKNTPVPLAYTSLTHRIVALYVLALPFGLHSATGPLMPVVVGFIAFCFLGLDHVGSQIEDPFEEDPNDLPLASLSARIENDLRARLGDPHRREEPKPVDGILL
jgi:putative membrane protein